MNQNTELASLNNWNFCHFESKKFKAFVSYLAEPSFKNNGDCNVLEYYCVTLTNLEDVEVKQTQFESLDKAICCLNDQYGHWKLVTRKGNSSSTGCDSCQAH